MAKALGGSIATVRPGSAEAAEAKKVLIQEGLWSQYLATGGDPLVFPLCFIHHVGDTVTIRSHHLGALINQAGRAEELPEWSYGLRQLFDYLHRRRQITGSLNPLPA